VERKAGEILSKAERAQGKRTDILTSSQRGGKSFTEQLAENSITPRQAERWQQLAAVPEAQFEASSRSA
jgi:hypothetical protein